MDLDGLATKVRRQLDEMAAGSARDDQGRLTAARALRRSGTLQLVLLNLVSNAIKYSAPAKPDSFIEIALCAHSGRDQMCTVCVRDSGSGHP